MKVRKRACMPTHIHSLSARDSLVNRTSDSLEGFFILSFIHLLQLLHLQERIPTMLEEEGARIRKPDYDLESYLNYNEDIYKLEDIANIHAEVSGHNDEDNWYWIIELKDGRFVLTSAGCYYTGWDCQSWGDSNVANSAEDAAMLVPEKEDYTGREVQRNLLAQVRGEQPFGLEVTRNGEA
jgi:hypothetical protein